MSDLRAPFGRRLIIIAGCCLLLGMPGGKPVHAQDPIVITAQHYWLYNDHVHVVAIIKNVSSEVRGNITAEVALADHGDVYGRFADLSPDKTVLRPNEETVLFIRTLYPRFDPVLGPVDPTSVTLKLSSAPALESDHPYLSPPPRLRYGALSVSPEGDYWRYNRVDGEFVNDSKSDNFEATLGIPIEGFHEIFGGQFFPFTATVVFLRDGEILGADRLF